MTAQNNQYKWPQIGNETAVSFLQSALLNQKISSTYIFNGLKDLGKFQVAKAFANNLILSSKLKHQDQEKLAQNSGDLQVVDLVEGKKNISISQIRELIKALNMSSFLNSYKVGIIKEAHKLSIEAANALLKTLEEPQNKVVIILLTEKIDNLPKTIVSRSQILQFYPVKKELIYDYLLKNYNASRDEAKQISRLCAGKPALAVKLLEDKEYFNKQMELAGMFVNFLANDENYRLKELEAQFGKKLFGASGRELAFNLLDIWEIIARDLMLIESHQEELTIYENYTEDIKKVSKEEKSIEVLKAIKKAREYLSANLSPKACLDEFLISF